MILLFKPHRPGFVRSRVSRFLIPATSQLGARGIARRDARGPQSAARTCCLRTTSTGRKKGVFFGYFLCTSKESDPRYSIAEALALTNAATTTSTTLPPNLSRQRERGKITSCIPAFVKRRAKNHKKKPGAHHAHPGRACILALWLLGESLTSEAILATDGDQ